MLKKVALVLLGVAMLLALAGCGVRKSIEDKITEGIIENIAGEDVDVDLDGDTITVEGEEGEQWTFGGGEWPKSEAAGLIPEFKKGNITAVIDSSDGCWITIEDVDEQDYLQYIEALKSAGFAHNTTQYSDESSVLYGASLEDESASILVSYSGDKEMVIQLVKSE